MIANGLATNLSMKTIVNISCSTNCACLPRYLIDGTVNFTRTIDTISARFYSNFQGVFV